MQKFSDLTPIFPRSGKLKIRRRALQLSVIQIGPRPRVAFHFELENALLGPDRRRDKISARQNT